MRVLRGSGLKFSDQKCPVLVTLAAAHHVAGFAFVAAVRAPRLTLTLAAIVSRSRIPVHGAVKLTLPLARVSKSRIPGHGWSHKETPTSDDTA